MHRLAVADLEVIEARELEFTGARALNGFVVWFDAGFEPWSDLSLNTSPALPPTHWNQELLLLDDTLHVAEKHKVQIGIKVERNSYWRRHWILHLSVAVVSDENGETVQSCEKVYYHHRFPGKS